MNYRFFTLFLFSAMLCANFSLAEITRTHLHSDEIKKIQSVPADDGFYFVVVGDTRDGDEVFRYFMGLAERMNAAFVMDVGDIVHSGTGEEYEQRLDIIESFDVPYVTAIGNHERHAPGGLDRYRKIFGELDYYFDYGGVRFVSVDNCSVKYEIRDEQLEWLDEVLDTDLIKFVFMHAPPETWLWDDSNFSQNAARFMETVEKHGVRKVFAGHKHAYDRFTRGGTEYIITGGGGAPLEPDVDIFYSRDGGAFYHALLVEVKGGRVMDVLLKPTPWEVPGFPSPSGRPMDFAYAGYMVPHSPIVESVEAGEGRTIKVKAFSDPRAAVRGLEKVALVCSRGGGDAADIPLTQDIFDERVFTGEAPNGISGEIECAVTAVDPAGGRTMEILPPDGSGELFWVTIDEDPDDRGYGVPPQQDILSVRLAADSEKYYFRVEFAKKPEGGRLSPMRANIYGVAIAPEDLQMEKLSDLLKSIPIFAYAPLAPSFGMPECSFVDAESIRKRKPKASSEGIACRVDGATLEVAIDRDKAPAGDAFKIMAATATITARGKFEGDIMDSSTMTTVSFRTHRLAVQ